MLKFCVLHDKNAQVKKNHIFSSRTKRKINNLALLLHRVKKYFLKIIIGAIKLLLEAETLPSEYFEK